MLLFLFLRQSDKTPLDGCTAMRKITEECPGLKEPKRIRTREMRRYLATTTQVLVDYMEKVKIVVGSIKYMNTTKARWLLLTSQFTLHTSQFKVHRYYFIYNVI